MMKHLMPCVGALVALAFSAASASAVTAGTFTGKTADQRAISFRVSGNHVRSFSFQARWRCNNGTGFVSRAKFATIRIRGQRFSGAFANKSRSLATTIRGTFKGRTATGTIARRAHFNSHRRLARKGALVCSVNTPFSARRR